MTWWWIKHRLRGYRTVDAGTERTMDMALMLSADTAARYQRGRPTAVNVRGHSWSVMVKGWNPRKENG